MAEPSLQVDKNSFLGRGSFGTVYKGWWNSREVAVKEITNDEGVISMREILPFTKNLDHENIIKIYAVRNPHIIMELCDTNLHKFLCVGQEQRCDKLRFIFEIATAMDYLHKNDVIHRDLKPDNILLKWYSRKRDPVLKLCDFGLARLVDGHSHLSTTLGTQAWMAPEFFDSAGLKAKPKYTPAIDIFTMGKVFAFIIVPQKRRDELARTMCGFLRSGSWNTSKIGCSGHDSIVWLVSMMMELDFRDRPTAPEVLQMVTDIRGPQLLIGGGFHDSDGSSMNSSLWVLVGDSTWLHLYTEIEEEASVTGPVGEGFVAINRNRVSLYEYYEGRWEMRSLPSLREGRLFPGLAVVGRDLFVIGGVNEHRKPMNKVMCLANAAGDDAEWLRCEDAPFTCKWPILAVLGQKIIFILNTFDRDTRSIPVSCYDTETDSWEYLSPLPDFIISTDGASAVSVGEDHVYLVGGEQDLCVRFSLRKNRWRHLGCELNVTHKYGSPMAVNGNILLLGGSGSDGLIEELDVMNRVWRIRSLEMPIQLFHHFAIRI